MITASALAFCIFLYFQEDFKSVTNSKNYPSPAQRELPTDISGAKTGYIHGQRDEGYQQARRRSQQKDAYRSRTAKGTGDVLLVGGAIALSTVLLGISAYLFSQGSFSLPNTPPPTAIPDDSLQRRTVN